MTTMSLGPDEALYITGSGALHRVSQSDGGIATLAEDLLTDPPDDPFFSDGSFNNLLGFDVAENGAVYIAYIGNRRLLKIETDGTKSEIYHAKAPWSPAGVAVHKGIVYLLETAYQDAFGHLGPRVRKQQPDGRFETLVTIGRHPVQGERPLRAESDS